MHPAGHMSGRVVAEGTPDVVARLVPPSRVVMLDPADGSPESGVPRPVQMPASTNGEFEFDGILPGRYFLRMSTAWIVKSVTWHGRDYTDEPFDATGGQVFDGVQVVATTAGAGVSGTVRDEHGAPVAGSVVLIFPQTRAGWTDTGLWPQRIRSAVTLSTGIYSLTKLPAGDYDVVAVSGSSGAVQPDASLFESVARLATPVTLDWGRTRRLNLAVQRIP